MSRPRGYLHVVVHHARGLLAADTSLVGKKSSDPYVVLSLGERSQRTEVVSQNLDPVWGQAFCFDIGNVAPIMRALVTLSMKDHRKPLIEPLRFNVFDQDMWTDHDFLGQTSVDLQPMFDEPHTWQHFNQNLDPPVAQRSQSAGCLHVSLYFEPASRCSRYSYKILSSLFFAVAGAMMLISMGSRWTSHNLADGALMQPGVYTTLFLGVLCCFSSCAMHFVLAHFRTQGGEDKLLEQCSHNSLQEVVGMTSMSLKGEPGPVTITLTPASLTDYEINVRPNCDCFLPAIVVARLLAFGGLGLAILSLFLEYVQDWSPEVHIGEVLVVVAMLSIVAGMVTLIRLRQMNNKLHAAAEHFMVPSGGQDLHQDHHCDTTLANGSRFRVVRGVAGIAGTVLEHAHSLTTTFSGHAPLQQCSTTSLTTPLI